MGPFPWLGGGRVRRRWWAGALTERSPSWPPAFAGDLETFGIQELRCILRFPQTRGSGSDCVFQVREE